MLDAFHDAPAASEELAVCAPRDAGAWLCVRCRHRVSHEIFVATLGGASAHTRSNPRGQRFSFRIFALAPGAQVVGEPTLEASWFPPRVWQFAHCARCENHLGWCFTGADVSPSFALINDRLEKEQDR